MENIDLITAIFWSEGDPLLILEGLLSFLATNSDFFKPSLFVRGHIGERRLLSGISLKELLLGTNKPIYLIQEHPVQSMLRIEIDLSQGLRKHTIAFDIDNDWFQNSEVDSRTKFFLGIAEQLYNKSFAYFGYVHNTTDAIDLWSLRQKPALGRIRGSYWATFIGPSEIENLDLNLLLTSPAMSYRRLADGGICILAGANPVECTSKFQLDILQSINLHIIALSKHEEKALAEKVQFVVSDSNLHRARAEQLINIVFSKVGLILDVSLDGLLKLEDFIHSQGREFQKNNEELLGAYLGEVIIKLMGGKWVRLIAEEWFLVLHDDSSFSNPYGKVRKMGGEERNSLSWYVKGLLKLRSYT